MNNAVFGRTIKNVRKHRNNKPVATKKRRNYSVSKPNHHTAKFFTEISLVKEMRSTQILMTKPVYLELSILHMSKIAMYEFWSNNVKPKAVENAKLCYMDTDSFIVLVKSVDIYEDTTEGVETRFDTSNFELD